MNINQFFAAAISVAFIGTVYAEASKKDQEFLTKAATGGFYEVEAGKLAEVKGASEEVKAFGAMLTKDHGMANDELKQLAMNKGVSLPNQVSTTKQSRLDKISKAKNFDLEFVKKVGMDDHKSDIALFEKAAKGSDDSDVKAFARKSLPALKNHHDHAVSLRKLLKYN